MNGWGGASPLGGLQANPVATVHLIDGPPRRVSAREGHGEDRDRLWARWRAVEPDPDEYTPADLRALVRWAAR